MRTRSPGKAAALPERHWFFGRHAVAAALANPGRPCLTLEATAAALEKLGKAADRPGLTVLTVRPERLSRLVAADVQHQGLVLEVGPLPRLELDLLWAGADGPRIALALDEINDPRNLGAILRSACALGAAAVIVPERRSAAMGPACAKAASGALDILPIIEVPNLAQALARLKEQSFWVIGLDAEAPMALQAAPRAARRVLVLGGEGSGLRRLVAASCDVLARLPMRGPIESLNVAAAASIALYELGRAESDAAQ